MYEKITEEASAAITEVLENGRFKAGNIVVVGCSSSEIMLQNGLISLSEFNKITTLNRKSFSPALAQIMPENR